MPSSNISVVDLDSIPSPPYETPKGDLTTLFATAKRMEVICRDKGGMGLAAAQVGLPWRLFVARTDWPSSDRFSFFFDCSYEPIGEESFSSIEGCISIPRERYSVKRYANVQVKGFRIVEGEEGFSCELFSEPFTGVASVLMQHEIDHDFGRDKMIDRIGTRLVLS
jgi:peptide deformylase